MARNAGISMVDLYSKYVVRRLEQGLDPPKKVTIFSLVRRGNTHTTYTLCVVGIGSTLLHGPLNVLFSTSSTNVDREGVCRSLVGRRKWCCFGPYPTESASAADGDLNNKTQNSRLGLTQRQPVVSADRASETIPQESTLKEGYP